MHIPAFIFKDKQISQKVAISAKVLIFRSLEKRFYTAGTQVLKNYFF